MMAPELCRCDGPPHPYDPTWCVVRRSMGSRAPIEIGYVRRGDARRAAAMADAEAWARRLDDDAHWASNPQDRAQKQRQAGLLRALIEAAR